MNLQLAKSSIGKAVISWDHGNGARIDLRIGRDAPLGPFILLQITKSGMAICRGMEHVRLRPKLLFLVEGLERFCPPSLEEQLKNRTPDLSKIQCEPICFQELTTS